MFELRGRIKVLKIFADVIHCFFIAHFCGLAGKNSTPRCFMIRTITFRYSRGMSESTNNQPEETCTSKIINQNRKYFRLQTHY